MSHVLLFTAPGEAFFAHFNTKCAETSFVYAIRGPDAETAADERGHWARHLLMGLVAPQARQLLRASMVMQHVCPFACRTTALHTLCSAFPQPPLQCLPAQYNQCSAPLHWRAHTPPHKRQDSIKAACSEARAAHAAPYAAGKTAAGPGVHSLRCRMDDIPGHLADAMADELLGLGALSARCVRAGAAALVSSCRTRHAHAHAHAKSKNLCCSAGYANTCGVAAVWRSTGRRGSRSRSCSAVAPRGRCGTAASWQPCLPRARRWRL